MKELFAEVQAIVLDTWLEVFHEETEINLKDSIPTDTDFFELGGNSIMAMQIIARLRDKFQIKLPLQIIFEETSNTSNTSINSMTIKIIEFIAE